MEENEMNIIIIKKNNETRGNMNRIYLLDFENNNETVFLSFKKYCYEKLENKNFKEEYYKIPMWLMFYQASSADKGEFCHRKFSIDDYKDDEICFEIKWIYVDEGINGNNNGRQKLL